MGLFPLLLNIYAFKFSRPWFYYCLLGRVFSIILIVLTCLKPTPRIFQQLQSEVHNFIFLVTTAVFFFVVPPMFVAKFHPCLVLCMFLIVGLTYPLKPLVKDGNVPYTVFLRLCIFQIKIGRSQMLGTLLAVYSSLTLCNYFAFYSYCFFYTII